MRVNPKSFTLDVLERAALSDALLARRSDLARQLERINRQIAAHYLTDRKRDVKLRLESRLDRVDYLIELFREA